MCGLITASITYMPEESITAIKQIEVNRWRKRMSGKSFTASMSDANRMPFSANA
jgi:hypothetical protein